MTPTFVIIDGSLNEPVGTVEGADSINRFSTFDTLREAQLEILEDLEEYIRQFKAGEERDFEDCIHTTMYADEAYVSEDGRTLQWQGAVYGLNTDGGIERLKVEAPSGLLPRYRD